MRRHRSETKEFSEINITPFTDVVLVLLIIFMIASPVIISGALDVKLPFATSSGKTSNEKIQISININKEIFVDTKLVSESEMVSVLKSLTAKNINAQIVLNADHRLTHGLVVHILDLIKSSGATKILIGTESKENYYP